MASPATDDQFRRLYEGHFEAVRAYCLRRLPVADANDAVAEVFVIAWKKMTETPTRGSMRPWLYGVARNVIAHSKRSVARRTRLTEKAAGLASSPEPGPELQILQRSQDRELLDALATLGDDDREVLQLKAWEELTAPQIAEIIGISEAAAKKRIARAYKKLERALRRTSLVVTEPHSQKGGER